MARKVKVKTQEPVVADQAVDVRPVRVRDYERGELATTDVGWSAQSDQPRAADNEHSPQRRR